MTTDAQEIKFPSGFHFADIVSWGSTGMICLDRSSQTIVKSPHREEDEEHIAIERTIYQLLERNGVHPGILKYHGSFEHGIRLEFAPHGDLQEYINKTDPAPSIQQRLRWCQQIAAALQFAHSHHIIHGDLRCANVFLDTRLDAKLGDFGGSSLDGSPLCVWVTASHQCPGSAQSIKGDIFALGSSFYEVMTGHYPYAGISETEIEALYAKSEFPDVKSLGCISDIILNCWQGKYNVTETVIEEIEAIVLYSREGLLPVLVPTCPQNLFH